jgi:hypothetical protein
LVINQKDSTDKHPGINGVCILMSARKSVRNKFWGALLAIAITFCLAASSITGATADDQGGISNLTCSPDMISYWKLDETEGTTFKDYFGSNDGVCTGDKCPLPEEGIVNGAQRFLGSQEIVVPSSSDFDWDSESEFTIELWVNIPKEEASNDTRVFVGRHTYGSSWWVGYYPGSYTAAFGIRVSEEVGKEITGGPALNDGEWHHVVGEHDGSNDVIKLFVDRELAASAEVAFLGNWVSDQVISIGFHNPPPYYYYTGMLDEIAIYGRALPLDEIQYHYQNGLDGKGYCQPVELIINIEGGGLVTRSLPGPYIFGQEVTLTAEPDPGNIFYGWSGDLMGYENPATIKLNGNKVITATFTEPIWHTLTVDLVGQGSVVVEPDKELYLHGDSVSLEAVVEPGWVFSGWGGDLNGNSNPENLTMTDDFSVIATFIEASNNIYLPLTLK